MHSARSFRPAWIAVVLAVVASMIGATPAYAITGGQPDEGWHPQVGLLYYEYVDDDGDPQSGICSGTLIAPDVVLTAAHCLDELGKLGVTEILVSFDEKVNLKETVFFTASEWKWHPQFDRAAWPYTYDVGLVFLDQQPNWATGELPKENQLETLIPDRGASKQIFTDVGYGQDGVVTGDGPPYPSFPLERKRSTQTYHPGKNTWVGAPHGYDQYMLQLKTNPSARHGGGCGGDSGGPIFLDSSPTVIAIHTGGYRLGVDGSICGRVASVNHRIDTPDVLNWLKQEISLRAGE